MKILNWQQTKWFCKDTVFTLGEETVGALTFNNWSLNAKYQGPGTSIVFKQKGAWSSKILVTQNDRSVGEISSAWNGKATLKLGDSETYVLKSESWGTKLKWLQNSDDAIIRYECASLGSMGKGVININHALSSEIESLLVPTGVFISRLNSIKAGLFVAVFVPIIAGVSN
jgi:hypothetical protein